MTTGTLDIIHVDMDAFFAAVEQRDNPELRGKPVIVGGSPEGRGVVSTASYEARKYGVHSAMSAAEAVARCPHGIFVTPDHSKYARVSEKIRAVFFDYTDLVEPLSLDEAFLDVTGKGGGVSVATKIKRRITDELSLTASVGISYNKFLDKLASDMEKPDGFTVISHSRAKILLPELPVRKLWGVGPKTEQVLHALGLYTAGDITRMDPALLRRRLCSRAQELIMLAKGVDHRRVEPPALPKSIGEETTFSRDVSDISTLKAQAEEFCDAVLKRVRRHNMRFRTVTLKVRFDDFDTLTRSHSLQVATDDHGLFRRTCVELFDRVDLRRPVRLIGVSVSNLEPAEAPQQLHFDFLVSGSAESEDNGSSPAQQS